MDTEQMHAGNDGKSFTEVDKWFADFEDSPETAPFYFGRLLLVVSDVALLRRLRSTALGLKDNVEALTGGVDRPVVSNTAAVSVDLFRFVVSSVIYLDVVERTTTHTHTYKATLSLVLVQSNRLTVISYRN